MSLATITRRLARRSWGDRRLLACASLTLVVMRLAITLLPFRLIARVIGLRHGLSSGDVSAAQAARAARIGWAVSSAASHLPWTSTCLVQALAAAALLRLSGIAATLHLGVARDAEAENGVIAHAWLCCGALELTGASEREQFSELAAFRLP
jgi:hypothetical protein